MAVKSQKRIGGWLLLPLCWLLLNLLPGLLLTAVYLNALLDPAVRERLFLQENSLIIQWSLTLCTAILISAYSVWLAWLFFKRSSRVPRHYIIWLLIGVLLALKTFAFAPVTDNRAVQALLLSLAAAAILVPYFRRSKRVKETFTGA